MVHENTTLKIKSSGRIRKNVILAMKSAALT
jgi:hypothetical protein